MQESASLQYVQQRQGGTQALTFTWPVCSCSVLEVTVVLQAQLQLLGYSRVGSTWLGKGFQGEVSFAAPCLSCLVVVGRM